MYTKDTLITSKCQKNCKVKIVITIDNDSIQSMLQLMAFLPTAHTVCDVGGGDGLRVLLTFSFHF